MDDAILIFTTTLVGLGLYRLARDTFNAPKSISMALGSAVPLIGALLMDQPVTPTAIGAVVGSGGGLVYDTVAHRPETFLAFGDTHGNDRVRRAVVEAMLREQNVDFVVFMGDAVDSPDEWGRAWDALTRDLRERWTVYGTKGNHDDSAGWNRRFHTGAELPGGLRIVRMRRGTLYLVDDPAVGSNRILTDMATADRPFVVVTHKSPIAFSEQNASDALWTGRGLGEICGRADVILTGHMHVFGVGEIGSTNVVTAGIAGSKHYRCNPTQQPETLECDDSVRGYLRVEVGDTVDVTLRRVTIPD